MCMKKVLCIFLFLLLIIFPGCPDKEKQKSNDSNKVQVEKKDTKIDKKAAKVFIENYMSYVLKGDVDAMKSFYSDDLKFKIMSVPFTSNAHPVGYKMDTEEGSSGEEGGGSEESGGKDEGKGVDFKVHIYSSSKGAPYFSDDTYKYTVTMQDNKMAIDKMEKEKSTELYEKNDVLYKREGDKITGEQVISLKDMPEYITLSNTVSPGLKLPTPRDAFGPCALSPDGKDVVITTAGTPKGTASGGYAFAGIIKSEEGKQEGGEQESIKQQGGQQDAKQTMKLEGGMGGGAQQKKAGAEKGVTEEGAKQAEKKKPPSMKILDLYMGSKVNTVSFSPDGKLILVEFIPPSGLSRVRVYKSESSEPLELTIEKQFKPDRFAISSAYFTSPEELSFNVIPASDATAEEQRFKGTWQFNVKTEKLKQM